MHNQENNCQNNPDGELCTAYTYQSATVSVPVCVKPKVKTGEISTVCCGEPTVIASPYQLICSSKSGVCSYILKQNICIEVPVEISTDAYVGCPCIECGDVSEKFCDNCGG